jgi:hypothetical protein
MTFLELARMVVQQSGTIQGTLPTTVVGQSNRLKLIVDYVNEAYIDIQNAHRMWRWMQSEFTVDTTIGTQRYAGTDCTDQNTSAQIVRFSTWGFKGDGTDIGLSCYLTSAGPAEEGPLQFINWDRFYESQLRGVQTPNKPRYYSLTNDNKLIISPVPDDVYTLRGKYRKAAQYLTADADTPEMPYEFHTIIKDAALQYLEAFDEGPRIPAVRLRMLPNWSMLEHQQLPQTTWGEPLA